MPTAIIVEDQAAALADLTQALEEHCPQIEVLDQATTVVAAAKAIRQEQPDLLFLDIELPDGTGFDLLDILGEWPGSVIFTTGLNDQALRAFRYAAVDYLLKPIDPTLLTQAVQRAERALGQIQEQRQLLRAVHDEQDQLPARLALHSQERIQLVNIDDIIRCESEGNYTNFFLVPNKRLLVARTLKSYSALLKEHGFWRVHQSHLINPRHLQEYVKTDGGYLVMNDGTKIPVSVRRRAAVMKWLSS